MKDNGPIPPLLRQINDALTHVSLGAQTQAGRTDEGGRQDLADILTLFRSVVMLWGAQNAVLSGDAPLAREWMKARLDAISHELDAILAGLETLGIGRHSPDIDVAVSALDSGDTSEVDENFELIDFVNHVKGQRSI
ncbi:hypothetical protein [Thalassospira marina]|uniref:HPt domain-containing protein n=1 Tax=Thalassospira marina TaxID=2048283 RepID=A0ABM6Q7V3_9PROT|nr:hypothetical protein [Thalassospira marina]AUG52568.1 hypothetical protein CSC3H3_07440 [Thalassospira marina]